ncbi:MAG: hypothetical protein IPO26_05130 [Saprospiraceae bacterium]|nr:hypothetical protein [Saprospiraceae bacterium]
MAIPLLFLFVTSCNEQHVDETIFENQKVEIRTSDCENLGNGGSDCETEIKTGQYIINGCMVNVSYKLSKCGNDFSIKDFSYTFTNSSACNTIQQQWSALFNISSLAANNAMNAFYKQLSIMVEDYEFSLLDPDEFPCPSNNSTWSWIETHCHTLCATKGDGEEGDLLLNHVVCGYSCCIRSTSFCFENGVPKRTDVQINDLSDECEPVEFIACPNDSYDPNACQKSCARL